MIRFLLLALPLILGAAPQAWGSTDRPASSGAAVAFEDGLVSIQGGDAPVLPVLETLSRAAGIHIFLFEPLGTERVHGPAEGMPLEQFLGSVLKGTSHAVIYGPAGNGASGGHGPADPLSGSSPVMTGPPEPEAGTGLTAAPAKDHAMLGKTGHVAPAGTVGPPSRIHALVPGVLPGEGAGDSPSRRASIHGTGGNSPSAAAPGVSAYGFTPNASQGAGAAPALASAPVPASSPGVPSSASGSGAAEGMEGPPAEAGVQGPTGPQPEFMQNMQKAQAQTYQEALAHTIARLEARIQSGESDAEYTRWAQVRGGGYVIHDRDRLAYYQQLQAGGL